MASTKLAANFYSEQNCHAFYAGKETRALSLNKETGGIGPPKPLSARTFSIFLSHVQHLPVKGEIIISGCS